MTASDQEINGDMIVDEVSELNLYLKNNSVFTGAVNSDGAAGSVYVEIEEGSKWVLTGDSYITSLTCGADAIDLNGFTLHVGDQTYEAGTESAGQAIEFNISSGKGNGSGAPEGKPGENGGRGGKGGPGGDGSTPPEKPDGQRPGGDGFTPPEKPDGQMPGGDGSTPPEKPDGQRPDGIPGQGNSSSLDSTAGSGTNSD